MLAGITVGFGVLGAMLADRWPIPGLATVLVAIIPMHFLIEELERYYGEKASS